MYKYKGDIEKVLHSPQQVVDLATKEIALAGQDGEGLKFGIPELDAQWVSGKRGKFIGIYADTSHLKSVFAKFSSRIFTSQLRGRENGLFWTNEDSVESVGISDLANYSGVGIDRMYSGKLTTVEEELIGRAKIQRMGTPLWVVGHSTTSRTMNPRLTVADFMNVADIMLNKQKVDIRFVWLDYLQLVSLANSGKGNKYEMYDDAIAQLRDLAMGYNLTVYVNTQVGRHTKERKWKMPQLGDAKGTSGFEEACDGAIGLWFIHKDMHVGTPIEYQSNGKTQYKEVTKELLLMQYLKQKTGTTRDIFAVDAVPEHGVLVNEGDAGLYRSDPQNYFSKVAK